MTEGNHWLLSSALGNSPPIGNGFDVSPLQSWQPPFAWDFPIFPPRLITKGSSRMGASHYKILFFSLCGKTVDLRECENLKKQQKDSNETWKDTNWRCFDKKNGGCTIVNSHQYFVNNQVVNALAINKHVLLSPTWRTDKNLTMLMFNEFYPHHPSIHTCFMLGWFQILNRYHLATPNPRCYGMNARDI